MTIAFLFMLSIEFDLEYTGNHRIRIHRSFLFENSLQYGLSSPWLLYLFLLLFHYYTSISCGKENCAWAHYIFSFVTIVFCCLAIILKVIYFRLKAGSRVTSGLGSQFQLSAIRSDVSGWK